MSPSAARKSAAVTIFAHRRRVSDWEKIDLQQCASVLSKHDKILVCPRGMPADEYAALLPGLRTFPVDPKWMRSYIAYNDFKSNDAHVRARSKSDGRAADVRTR